MLNYVGLPEVAKHVQPHRAINHIPGDSKMDMWLNPWMIDYSRQCKYGLLSSVWSHPLWTCSDAVQSSLCCGVRRELQVPGHVHTESSLSFDPYYWLRSFEGATRREVSWGARTFGQH